VILYLPAGSNPNKALQLAAGSCGSSLEANPANLNTNWSGGTLGYFGTFNIDERTDLN